MPSLSYRARGATAALIAASILLLAGPAAAADPEIHFTGETSKTFEYGEYWSFDLRAPFSGTSEYSYITTGTPSGYTPEIYTYFDPADSMQQIGSLFGAYDVAPLNAGIYTFKIHLRQSYADMTTFEGETATPAQLTVTPAKLGITVRVVPDPTNPSVALVTAAFTGRFVDEYQSSFFPSAAVSPQGEWHVSFVDSNGEVATARNVERAAGDDVLATSFAWTDGKPGEIYTVSADFVPAGSSAANFTVTPATDFSFTAADSARPVPTSTATGKPDASLPEPAGFGLPLWSLILIGTLIAGLAALLTILSVRLSKRPASTTGEGAA